MINKEEIEYAPAKTAAAAPVAATPQMQMPISQPVIADPQPTAKQGVQADAVPQQSVPQQVAGATPQMQMPTGQPTPNEQFQQDRAAMVAWQQQQAPAPQPQTSAPTPQQQQQAQQAIAQAAAEQAAAKKAEPGMTPEQREADKMRKKLGIEMPEETKIPEVNKDYWQKYGGYNWASNGGDFFKNAAEAGMPLYQAMQYYDQWRKDNGEEPLDMMHQYALLRKYDPFKSVKEQEEEEARLKRHQKWQKIGNVFNNLANLYGTMRGAPAAKYETDAELTERQQKQLDRVKALRQAAGAPYLEALEQKKADEFKKWQMENDAKRLAEQERYHDAVLAGQAAERARREKEGQGKLEQGQQKINQGQQKIDNTKEYQNKKLAIDKQRANNQSASVRLNQKKYDDQKDFTEVTEVEGNTTGTKKKTTKTRVRNPKQAAGNISKAKGGYSKAAELTRKLQGRK